MGAYSDKRWGCYIMILNVISIGANTNPYHGVGQKYCFDRCVHQIQQQQRLKVLFSGLGILRMGHS